MSNYINSSTFSSSGKKEIFLKHPHTRWLGFPSVSPAWLERLFLLLATRTPSKGSPRNIFQGRDDFSFPLVWQHIPFLGQKGTQKKKKKKKLSEASLIKALERS